MPSANARFGGLFRHRDGSAARIVVGPYLPFRNRAINSENLSVPECWPNLLLRRQVNA